MYDSYINDFQLCPSSTFPRSNWLFSNDSWETIGKAEPCARKINSMNQIIKPFSAMAIGRFGTGSGGGGSFTGTTSDGYGWLFSQVL